MKRDIRGLFKDEELHKKKLPESHRNEFLEKLEKLNKREKKKSFFQIWKIAASIVLILSMSYYFLNIKSEIKTDNKSTLFVQVKQIEKEYLQHINQEWNNFVKLTNDQKLIHKYEVKLLNLSEDYEEISKQFKKTPSNVFVLEKLIKNLQTRLQVLKDIQNHIQELQQKNKTYETIVI